MMLGREAVRRRKLAVVAESGGELCEHSQCPCDTCRENDECEYAFDPYNWGNDMTIDECLGAK